MKNFSRTNKLITKSLSDKRNYLYKQLPNQLKCLLIEDKEADKSAAAMNVNVGSLMDPKEFYGLAHFLEHMLFMGTEKYPHENDFMEFLNQNSGHSNAYTDLDATNYFFEVSNDSFVPAVDRFAQFFIKPLFNNSAVEREMQAVDSENKKNLQMDSWRFLQILRSEGYPNSIFTRFATGNLQTLKKPHIRDALVNYHKQNYSSNLMSLVLLSPKPLTEMEKITDYLFSLVPENNNVSKNILQNQYAKVYPYDVNNLNYFYKIIPVKDKDELIFYWFINENLNLHYHKKPLSYLSALFGHEGPNSLASSLIKDDLITHLSCGYHTIANTFTKFALHIDLSQKGLQNYENVIGRVLHYINKIKSKEINRNFFEEIKQINKIKFDFKNKEDPTHYVSELAHRFTVFEPEDILSGPYLINSIDEELIKKYLMGLDVKNMNIYLVSKKLKETECQNVETWYGTKFSKTKFNEHKLSLNNENVYDFYKSSISQSFTQHNLDYPPQNKFIPTNFQLLEKSETMNKHPVKIIDFPNSSSLKSSQDVSRHSTLWYKQDDTFHLPKAVILLQIYMDTSIIPHKEYEAICSIWNAIFENELKEISYMASEASISFRMHFNLEGIYIHVTGFNSSLKVVLYEMLTKFKQLIKNKNKIDNLPEKIQVQIEDLKKTLKNFYFSAPYTQVITYLDLLLREPTSTPDSKLDFLENLESNEFDIFDFFLENFLKKSKFEWLIQGNISPEESKEICQAGEKILLEKPLKEDEAASCRIVELPENVNYYYIMPSVDPNNQNSSIVSFFQVGKLNDYETCCLFIIETMMKEKFFDELRTKQTLGYIVKLAHRVFRKIEGIICVVQSSVKSPEDIQQRITAFINHFKDNLPNMGDDIFEMHRHSVITDLKQKDLKLIEEASRNFSEIKKREFKFDRKHHLIEILEKIKRKDVEDLFEKIFFAKKKRLDVELLADNHQSENESFEKDNNSKAERRRIYSVSEFKKSVSLYPDFFSMLQNLGPKF